MSHAHDDPTGLDKSHTAPPPPADPDATRYHDGAANSGAATAPPGLDRGPEAGSKPPDDRAFTSRYEVLGEVGRGAMGVVYRVRHKRLDRDVAVKVLLLDSGNERFLREARLLAKIQSPYVVAVHDFEILCDGRGLLVMEWVEGADLQKIMRRQGGPLPEDMVLAWMRHTCEGMAAAAEHGVIHRDLKPSNLLVDRRGWARVADFGLARGPAHFVNLTHSGDLMGTPLYMAPEQAEDPHSVDTRADIYSFGATFYHALTGTPPFEGRTGFSVLYKHKTEPLISPRARRPDLSERTSDILERCLAKSPADRFSCFAELLEQFRTGSDWPSPWVDSNDPVLAGHMARYQARRDSYLNERQAWNVELDVWRFPRGQVLRIVRGDIVKQQVDAVVSSDTSRLSMSYGVSEAIRLAAGQAMAAEAQWQAPVRPGRAAVTSAGKLRARFIFHGATVGYVRDQIVRPSRDLIAEIMASCLYHADTHDVRSIAFPLLGTGGQGFPRDVCLDTMFHVLARTFLRGLTSLEDARIVMVNP